MKKKLKSPGAALRAKQCHPCRPGTPALTAKQVHLLMGEIDRWKTDGKEISKTFDFKNYYQTMAFVNAVAFMAHRQDHHPDLEVGYNKCVVRYSTHSVGGLSDNDFICAANLDGLLANAG